MAETKRPRLDEAGEGPVEAPGEDGLENLDDPTVQALHEADALQQQLEQINDEASDRVLAVEQEFNKKRRPVYAQRNAALAKIPGFWKRVLMVHPVIRGIVTEADLDIMDYLTEVDVEDFEDIKSGYRMKFTFAEGNPFFSNRVLSKELKFADDASLTVTGDSIQWHPGMEPAADEGQQPGEKRPLGNQYNLFSMWFDGQHESALGHDEFADVLKDDIWPDPMRWFREAEEAGVLFAGEDDEGEGADEFEEDEYGDEGGEADEEEGDGDGVEYVVEGEEGFEGADEGEEEDEGAEGDDGQE